MIKDTNYFPDFVKNMIGNENTITMTELCALADINRHIFSDVM